MPATSRREIWFVWASTMPEFPPVADLLPHTGEMVLLHEVYSHSGDTTICTALPSKEGLFANADGRTGAWLGLELMAQCLAVHSGLVRRQEGGAPRIGLLVSSRRLRFLCTHYDPSQKLRIQCQHIWGESTGMVSFDCSIHDEESEALMAEGRLNCFVPDNGAGLEITLRAETES